jgi:hypothetical protein
VPAVDREQLGAWLVRCNPHRTDLAVRAREPVRSWCVADNYRSRLMAPGDDVLLWVSGRHPRWERGIWGAGRITAAAERDGAGLQVGLLLTIRDRPLITDAELRAAGVADLEVQRMPQGSNPSWISRERFERIRELA